MANAGETIEDPVTGERCHWLVTASQTGGRLVRAEWWSPPGTGSRDPHVHRRSEERVEVSPAGHVEDAVEASFTA